MHADGLTRSRFSLITVPTQVLAQPSDNEASKSYIGEFLVLSRKSMTLALETRTF